MKVAVAVFVTWLLATLLFAGADDLDEIPWYLRGTMFLLVFCSMVGAGLGVFWLWAWALS